jgi:hypothetical protein
MLPWVAVAGLVLSILSGAGAWWYRSDLAAGEVAGVRRDDQLREDRAVEAATRAATREGRALQASADVREARLAALDSQVLREADDAALMAVHVDLVRVASCPIPLADLQLLIAGPALLGGGQLRDGAGPARPDPAVGTVAASAVIETCERARAVFERNGARLRECVGAYDDARAACNRHAPDPQN